MAGVEEFGEEVVAVAELLGILTRNGEEVSVNADWFSDPLGQLKSMGQRADSLVKLCSLLLGPGVSQAIDGFQNAQWYRIPYPGSDESSVLCLVAPQVAAGQDAPPSGNIGFGLLYSLIDGNLTYSAYAYLPLISYGPTGAEFIGGSDQHPCQFGLSVRKSDQFSVDEVTFSALNLSAKIYLSNQAPSVELEFQDLKGPSNIPQNPFNSLKKVRDPEAQPWLEKWIGEVIVQTSPWLNLPIGDFWLTIGDVLVAANLLRVDDTGTYSLDLSEFNDNSKSGLDLAIGSVFGALLSLYDTDGPIPILELPGGGLYLAQREVEGGGEEYGLRLMLDVSLTPAGDSGKKPPVAADLSLGSWLTGEDDTNNWVQRSNSSLSDMQEPGLSIYVLRYTDHSTFEFAPGFALSSVGLNITGGANTPLVHLSGYTLQGAELRAYLDSKGWVYGFAGRFDGLGFPLGPRFGSVISGTQTNPVAHSLLSSSSGGSGAKGDKDPVNPAFSVSAAYMQGGSFVVQLYDKDGAATNQVIIPIQRTLGPLRAEKLGLGWVHDDSKYMLSLLLDGGISVAGLNVDLVGLSVGIPASSPTDFSSYVLDLNGLGITISSGEVEVSAALVKLPPDAKATPPRLYTQYDGAALIKAASYTVSAVGSYAYVVENSKSGYASLFLFGIVDANLGGPAFFYVTGLAAGFGYNRALVLPDQAHVPQFPLVAAAGDPSVLGGKKELDGTLTMPDPATALAKMDQIVPPERGAYWLAAGVRFTSFDLINSIALLVVEFGNELEIAVLGLSWMSLPPPSVGGAPPTERYAYLELGIEMKLLPSKGIFSATGILTPNSFVIDPACKLTGGFAFYIWFGNNTHAGEFVFTLGGYHPNFAVPNYYPTVPKLGFNWPVSSHVTISGDAYFALTPSAVMVGAGLQVLYSSGHLRAWFKAQMDALIQWAPFHYQLDIRVSLGASYRLTVGSISINSKVELGADLTISGPPMSGRVHVHWSVISFTVNFGANEREMPPPLEWKNTSGTGFSQTLLPHNSPEAKAATTLMQGERAFLSDSLQVTTGPAPPPASGIYTITANAGLLNTFTADGSTIWVVRPNHFVFSVITAIPATQVDIVPAEDHASGTDNTFKASYSTVPIRPMGVILASSVFTVKLTLEDDNSTYDLAGKFSCKPALAKVPAAKWGPPLGAADDPEMNALVPDQLMGLENITPLPPTLTPPEGTLEIDVEHAFTFDTVDQGGIYTPGHLPLKVGQTPVDKPPQVAAATLQQIGASVTQPAQVGVRNDIFAALRNYGVDPGTNGPLVNFAADPGAYITGNPMLYQAPGSQEQTGRGLL